MSRQNLNTDLNGSSHLSSHDCGQTCVPGQIRMWLIKSQICLYLHLHVKTPLNSNRTTLKTQNNRKVAWSYLPPSWQTTKIIIWSVTWGYILISKHRLLLLLYHLVSLVLHSFQASKTETFGNLAGVIFIWMLHGCIFVVETRTPMFPLQLGLIIDNSISIPDLSSSFALFNTLERAIIVLILYF